MAHVGATVLRVPGLVLTEHEFSVPLDHARPEAERITVFAREVADPDGRDRPFLVFLQGGPGSEAPRPTRLPTSPGWLDRALADYRVLMLDQRGTGRSTPLGVLPGLTPPQQADPAHPLPGGLDRRRLRGGPARPRRGPVERPGPVLRRLLRPELPLHGGRRAPARSFFTGGVPPVGRHIDEVYAATYATMRERNRRYHATLPRGPETAARGRSTGARPATSGCRPGTR